MTTPLPTNVAATDWNTDPDKGAVEHRQWHDALHGVVGPRQFTAPAATDQALIVRGAASQTADLQQWQSSAGSVLSSINSNGALYVTTPITSGVLATLRGGSGQTADLQQWQNVNGSVLSSINSNGALFITTPINNGVLATLRGGSAQTADLQQWQDSAGTPLVKVTGGGDVEVTSAAKGVILRSPDGTRYRITVANGGALSTTAVV